MENVPGAEQRNHDKLKARIQAKTGWSDVSQIYCGGVKLESFHMFRVHSIMSAGLPLVVLGEGEEYDAEAWAPLAERPSEGSGCCCCIS